MQKLLYMAALSGALKKANDAANFNFETQVNDLWVRISDLRHSLEDAEDVQQGLIQERQAAEEEALKHLIIMTQKLNQMMNAITSNLGV